MAGEHRFCGRRAEAHGAQSSHAADEAIHQHGHTGQRTAQKNAAQACDIKAAQLCHHVQRVFGVWFVDKDAPADGVHLAGQPFVRKARAAPGHPFDRLAQQHRRHRAGGGGVANAHLAGGDEPVAVVRQLPGKGNARPNGLHGLRSAHGRASRKVCRAGCNAAVSHAGHRFARDAHIHGQHVAVRRAGHLAHAGAAHGEVLGHGTGHFLPGLAHALGHHAVVGAEHRHHPAGEVEVRAAGEGGSIFQHGLKGAQPAQRFCKTHPVGVCRRAGGFVRGCDGSEQGFQFGFGHFCCPFV